MKPKIYADFLKTDGVKRPGSQRGLLLTCRGTHQDLEKNGITLSEGIRLLFYNDDVAEDGEPDDLVVEGEVHYSDDLGQWIALIDWNAIRNESELEGREP